jgi:hypothetical protein
MSRKNTESQQESQGIAIGTQGNQGGGTSTPGMKGPNRKSEENESPIPNQDRSSSANQDKSQKDQNKERSK